MKRLVTFIVLFVVALSASELFRFVQFFRTAEEALWDLRIRFFAPPAKPDPDIVIVALDEETMKNLPFRSPIPRHFLAKLHEQITVAGPRLVAYDLFFKDPSFPEADGHFLETLKKSPPYAVSLGRDGPGGALVEDTPLDSFQTGLAGWGLADLPLNPFSQVVRMANVSYKTSTGTRPTFVGAIYKGLIGVDADAMLGPVDAPRLGLHFPIRDETGALVVRYLHPAGAEGRPSIPTYSAALVAKGLLPKEWLASKIVIVGATFNDAQDAFLTPFYSKAFGFRRVPGVEIHAQILSSLLTGQFFPLFYKWQDRLLVILIIALAVLVTVDGKTWRLALIPLLMPTLVILGSVIWMKQWGVLVPTFHPIVSGLFAYFVSLGWRVVIEGRQRRWLKSTFSKYVSPAVVDELVRHPEMVSLGGEVRTVTCLFTDIENFTTLSERLDPKTVVSFLNEYLTAVSSQVLKHNGTIDKYVGDSVVAIFGAPLHMNDHAGSAVNAAFDIVRVSETLAAKWCDTLGQRLVTRVGIHTGEAVVGNIGSEVRLDYTAIGDTVNTASRLEGLNKEYGTRIIISAKTKGLASDAATRYLGEAKLKGRTVTMPVYEACN